MAESQEFKPKGEDEIRQQVVEDYGLDPNDAVNQPFIEKAVKKEIDWQTKQVEFSKKEIEHEKKLSKAIQQKTKYRAKVNELAGAVDDDDDENGEPKPEGKPALVPAPNTKPENDEKLSSLEKEVADLKKSNHRREHSHLKDEEYNTVLSVAGSLDKFEETLNNNSMIKSYIETNKVNDRVNNATGAPSTRTAPDASMDFVEVDLSNPEHTKWLKSDPERLKEYDRWLEKGGSKTLSN